MTIEVALLISGLAVAFSIYFGITANKRNKTKDDKQDASQMTTVIVGLESIKDLIKEMKADMSSLKDDVKVEMELRIRLEESLKSAWKRIEILEAMLSKKG